MTLLAKWSIFWWKEALIFKEKHEKLENFGKLREFQFPQAVTGSNMIPNDFLEAYNHLRLTSGGASHFAHSRYAPPFAIFGAGHSYR